jgi:hypothetical protein
MNPGNKTGRALSCAAGIAALVFAACGGGGGGGGGGPTAPPPPPASGVTFTAAGPAGSNVVFLDAGSPSSGRFVLEVRVSDVVDLYGVSLDLEYPQNLLRFQADGTREGDFLTGQDIRTEIEVLDRPEGNLVIGYGRFGDAPGVDGSGLLFAVEFTAVAGGNGSFVIDDNDALGSGGGVQGDVSWVSGSVSVSAP